MLKIKQSFKRGFSFGLTSGIITTLGLIVGLHSGTHAKLVIISGILVIAVADSLSAVLGDPYLRKICFNIYYPDFIKETILKKLF